VVIALEADPAFMAQRERVEQEKKADDLLAMARNFSAADLDEKAAELFEQIIDEYPDTPAAETARGALGQ
ncbi:MAG: hypothetical protein AAFX76_10970, partial [Planctomycetota bacterium]